MLTCYIIDDEPHAIEVLADYINKTPLTTLTGTSADPVMGLHTVLQTMPDILFLDIDMPVLSGLDLYPLVNNKLSVVFTTAYANYAVDAFDLNASDFLLKPVRYERFIRCVQKLTLKSSPPLPAGNLTADHDFLFIQTSTKAKIIKIYLDDIAYIESLHNYVLIHMVKEHHTVYISLKELMERLPAASFSRIHKSYIINNTKIRQIEGNRVYIDSFQPITIGTQYKDAFFEKVNLNLLRKR